MVDQNRAGATKLKEFIELIGAIVRWSALLIGGLCLLVYTHEIGQFPEGMNLGEGLAFYLVCIGFGIAYSIYWIGLTAIGCLIVGKPISLLMARHRVKTTRPNSLVPVDLSPMWDISVVIVGGFGLVILTLYILNNPAQNWTALFTSVCQGMLVALVLWARRQHSHLQSDLLVSADKSHRDTAESFAIRQFVFMAFLVVFPWLIGPNQTFIVDTAFTVAKLRKDSATIHVQKPWSIRVSQSTLKSSESFLGEDYVRFTKVNVLLRSVGEKVVIELPQGEKQPPIKLPVPATHIFVE
jgi:hypothetical protein